MADFTKIDNPELLEWLKSLETTVASRETKREGNQERRITLPKINMSRKLTQTNNRTLPEFQGSINFLPISWDKQRVVELNNVYDIWCPRDDNWDTGFMYKVLEGQFYPEGEVRDKINAIREKLKEYINTHRDDWKTVKRKNFTLIKGYVLIHRNTKGDIISSNLYGGDQLIEHKNVPALIICPVNRVQKAIMDDLNGKMNPVPYAAACYSDTPLNERQGWVSLTFKDKGNNAIGYDIKVTTDIINPAIMTDPIIPADFNPEDERVKLLLESDPIKEFLPNFQIGEGEKVYYNDDTLNRLVDRVDKL